MKIKIRHELIPMKEALRLLLIYKERSGQRHSWGEVERDIQNNGHDYAMLVDRKKLRFWETGRTQINDKAFEAITHFILSERFTSVVPETPVFADTKQEAIEAALKIAEKHDYKYLIDDKHKRSFFHKLNGLWVTRTPGPMIDGSSCSDKELIFTLIYATPVHNQDFALVHMQVTPLIPRPIEEDLNLYSGFMFLNVCNEKQDSEIILHIWNRDTGEKQICPYEYFAHSNPGIARRILYASTLDDYKMHDSERIKILDVGDERLTLAGKRLGRFEKLHYDRSVQASDDKQRAKIAYDCNIDYRVLKNIFDKYLWSVIPRNSKPD